MPIWRTIMAFSLPYALGTMIAFILWEHIVLPFENPWDQCSSVVRVQFAPANNVLRFAMLLALPVVVLFAFHLAGRKAEIAVREWVTERGNGAWHPDRVHGGLLVMLAIFIAMHSATFIAHGPFDVFHEGESLGPAVSYTAGQVPYRDFLFVHGVFQDPGRASLAFDLFGRSIGAVRTLESMFKVITWCLLAWFLFRFFRPRADKAFIVLAVMGALSIGGVLILMPRDLLTVILLLVCLQFARWLPIDHVPKGPLIGISLLLGVLPGLGLAWSFDRGVYYSVMVMMVVPILLWAGRWRRSVKLHLLAATALGAVAGWLVLGRALRWNYTGFFEFCMKELPLFKDLMDSYIFDLHQPAYAIPAMAASLGAYAVVFACLNGPGTGILPKLRDFLRAHAMECAMMLIGLLLFRNALGRADGLHLRYSWPFIILALTCFAVRGFPLVFTSRLIPPIAPRTLSVIMGGLGAAGLIGAIATGAWAANFPYRTPDTAYIPADDQAAAAYLKDVMGPDDGFITLTGEAGWYYYLDHPCPIRFNVIQFAQLPAYQDEVIDALASGRITHILHHNTNWYIKLDSCTNQQRIPRIMDHINAHFEPHRTIGHNAIWTLRR